MGKRKVKGKRKGKRATAAVSQGAQPAQGSSAVTAAADYLSLWFVGQQVPPPARGENDEPANRWKFNKTRQSFLLKGWPHRHRVSGASFKQLLAYMRSLPAGTQERTATQAREVASSAEVAEKALELRAAAIRAGAAEDEDKDADEDTADGTGGEGKPTEGVSAAEVEERRALLQIQRARALKVLKVLTGGAE